MKRNSAHSPGQSAPQKPLSGPTDGMDSETPEPLNESWDLELEQNDAVWDLLGKASKQEPSAFFARNVVREARLQDDITPSWSSRLASLFTPTRLTLGAAACACALVAYQMRPTPDSNVDSNTIVTAPVTGNSSDLTELIIEESLDAAAEDPTIFTRDELVAMIGF